MLNTRGRPALCAFVAFNTVQQASRAKDDISKKHSPIHEKIVEIGFADPVKDEILTNSLYVGNISRSATRGEMQFLLRKFPGVKRVILGESYLEQTGVYAC